jgi:hypothetical protein
MQTGLSTIACSPESKRQDGILLLEDKVEEVETGPEWLRLAMRTTRELDPSGGAGHHCRVAYMTEAKWVRIMCDYSADPLWGPDGAMNYLEDLPVTPDLRQRLFDWEKIYDMQDIGAETPSYDVAEFSRTGLELAREVKRQLPDWTIIYFDEEAFSGKLPNAPREVFEYEIEV